MKAIALVAMTLLNSVALFGQNTTGEAKKPNIVFILMDNLGYGEVGCYGGGILRGAATPRIDKLATEGTRLLNFTLKSTKQSRPLSLRPSVALGAPGQALFFSERRAINPTRRRGQLPQRLIPVLQRLSQRSL